MRGRISTWDYRRRRAQFALCTRRSCGRDKEPCVSLESGAARSFAVERRLFLAILGMAMPPTWLISILLPVACATRVDCLYPWQFQYGGRDLSTWGIQLYGIYSLIQVVLLTNCGGRYTQSHGHGGAASARVADTPLAFSRDARHRAEIKGGWQGGE